MLTPEVLASVPLLQTLPLERLDWLCMRSEALSLPAGAWIQREGDPSEGLFILLAGRVSILRQSDGVDMPIGQHEGPSFFGEVPILTDEPILVSLYTLTPVELCRVEGEDFRVLLHECRDFERTVFRAVHQRLRGLEGFIQNREKMAALGTLAAGLAHELNNPAAALVRLMQDLPDVLQQLEEMNFRYGQLQVDPAHTAEWQAVRQAGFEALLRQAEQPAGRDPVALEEVLFEWLRDYGVAHPGQLAAPLAQAGVEPDTLTHLTTCWRTDPTEMRDQGIRWLALSFDLLGLVLSGQRGAQRIFDLVQAMKSYTHLDQGARQMVDVHEGLESTLCLFSHRLRQGPAVVRHFDPSLPKILAYGSELNQVWTHLIENALDVLGPEGTLALATSRSGTYLQVDVMDDGPGIPAEIQSRIFEPFYTSKPVGQGTGLGLEIVRRIVENRHQGSVHVSSRPGRTVFSVCLPVPSSTAATVSAGRPT